MTSTADGNPLVAPRVDSTSGMDGLWLAEAIRDVTDSIQSHSWVDPTLAAGGLGLETAGMVVDPVGSLAGTGVAWLIEHLRPLSEALESLTGDPDQITAHANTWTNIATHTHTCAHQLTTTVEHDLADWTGQAADAYRAHTTAQANALYGIAQAATGIAQATHGAGGLVAAVRTIVRDLVADAVATIAARLPTWTAMTGATLGIATPWVISQVANLVTQWVTRIHRFLTSLLNSLTNLSPLLTRLTNLLTHQRTLLNNLARHDPSTLRLADTGIGPAPPPPPRSGNDKAHAHVSEGGDPHPIANATRLRPDELATGARLAAMFPERTFRESNHEGAEFLDDLGRSYDAMGGGARASQYLMFDRFTASIDMHLLKDNDFTVIDLTGFTEDQVAAIRSYVESLPELKQAKIIRIGF